MESFRVRNSAPDRQRKILLPISFGVSSVTLLHILDHHLKTQKTKTGRTGFALVVLFIDSSSINKSAVDIEALNTVQARYPNHQYSVIPLENIFRATLENPLLDLLPDIKNDTKIPVEEQLVKLVHSLTSTTARADTISILRTRLIVEEARRLGCEGILWGDSTTRLAERILAETAKGRGFSLPWQIADGESPFGITTNYPLRDLLKKELVSYVSLSEPSLLPLVHESPPGATQALMSSKNTTIEDLMKQYFESVEENFPSIVANVVRTTSKLEAGLGSASNSRCVLCNMPVSENRFGIHGWGGDQQDCVESSSSKREQNLCYGCTRSIPLVAPHLGSPL